MKYTLFLFILFFNIYSAKSQDLIILKNNSDTIKCKIVKDNIISLNYYLYNSLDTSLQKISLSEYEYYTIEQKAKSFEDKNKTKLVDIIYLKNKSDSILCKIVEDNITSITYKTLNPFDTTIHEIYQRDYEYYTLNRVQTIVKEKQIEYPINIEKPRKGAYKNFEEFINNKPSLECDFIVKKRSSFDMSMSGGNDYKVKSNDSIATYYKIKNEFWGVCDGENIYINCFKIGRGTHYSLLSIRGKVATFYAFQENLSGEVYIVNQFGAVGGAMIVSSERHVRDLFILDLKNGFIKRFGD